MILIQLKIEDWQWIIVDTFPYGKSFELISF